MNFLLWRKTGKRRQPSKKFKKTLNILKGNIFYKCERMRMKLSDRTHAARSPVQSQHLESCD
jgi:transcription initiation factor IIE alpha subunit